MATKRSVYVTSKKQAMTLTCEWAECEEVYSEMNDFLTHITEHIHAFVPKVIAPIDDNTGPDDFVCEWRDCNYEMSGGFLELMRHVYFHGFHIRLKSIGLNMTLKKQLRGCTMDSGSRNVIPDLPERFHCAWKHCECVSDNAWYFYQHVREHADEYPLGRNLSTPAKCMWEGCEAAFPSKYKVMEHLRSHSQEKTVACPTCGSLFSCSTKFTDHLRRQDDLEVQSFQCSHCSKRFSSERLLRDHMRKHVNNFKCPFCEMTTPSPSTLRQHIRYRHSDERDFQCPHCEASFKMNRDMERHIKVKHEKPSDYYCDHDGCSYRTSYEFQINEHMRNKHIKDGCAHVKYKQGITLDLRNLKDPKYVCQVCSSQFSIGRSLTRHLMGVHSFKWPPGHRRFRYKLGEDGNFHLQTVRYESYELSQQLQSERQRKALTGISVDGVRGAQKKCTRQNKGQALTLDNMSTAAPLDVQGQDEGQVHHHSGHKGQVHKDVANIENDASTASASGSSGSGKRKSRASSKPPRKKKRPCAPQPAATDTEPMFKHNVSEVDLSTPNSEPSFSRKNRRKTQPPKPHRIEKEELETKEDSNEVTEGISQDEVVARGDDDENESEDILGMHETLQIVTEDGEILLIQTNLPDQNTNFASPQQHITGIVTAQNTPQGVLLSIQPHTEGAGRGATEGAGLSEKREGITGQEEGVNGYGLSEKREGLSETEAELAETGAGFSATEADLNRHGKGQSEKEEELSPRGVGLNGKGADLSGKGARLSKEVEDMQEGGVGSMEQAEAGLVIHEEEGKEAELTDETGGVSHGLFYAVMNNTLQESSHKYIELAYKSSEEDQQVQSEGEEPNGEGEGPDGKGGRLMFDVQVPLGSDMVTIDLASLVGNRVEGASK